MAKKHFNLASLSKELEQSAFFPSRQSPTPITERSEEPAEPVEPTVKKHLSVETGNRVNTEPRISSTPPSTPSAFHFTPGTKADQKYTLAFTEEELEIIEDIKLDLRRRFGIKTSKVELVRCGLGELIEDFQKHGDQSRLVSRLKTRKHGTT
jgi:hypothetical protein